MRVSFKRGWKRLKEQRESMRESEWEARMAPFQHHRHQQHQHSRQGAIFRSCVWCRFECGGWKHNDRTDWGNGCGNERLEMGSSGSSGGSVRSGGFSILPDWWILGSRRGSMAQRCQPAGAMSAPPSSPRPRASIRELAVKEEKMVSTVTAPERLIDCVVSIHGWGNGPPLVSRY